VARQHRVIWKSNRNRVIWKISEIYKEQQLIDGKYQRSNRINTMVTINKQQNKKLPLNLSKPKNFRRRNLANLTRVRTSQKEQRSEAGLPEAFQYLCFHVNIKTSKFELRIKLDKRKKRISLLKYLSTYVFIKQSRTILLRNCAEQ
jgi:hypothetical protein